MDVTRAKDLLSNLLERASSSEDRTFLTSREIAALRVLLDDEVSSGEPYVPQNTASAPSVPPPVTPEEKKHELRLDLGDCWIEESNSIVCVDFGTSLSKAFATETDSGQTKYIDLAIGDGSMGNPLTSPSELLIADGKIFFGSSARQHVEDAHITTERVIDSIKQFITLGSKVAKLSTATLPDVQDPTSSLTHRDVLVLYLAHLMYLTEAALARVGKPGNLLRRFAHPAWSDDSKAANTKEMRRLMAEAIVLARSVGSDIATAAPFASLKTLLGELAELPEIKLPMMLIGEPVREATAAGAGALLSTPESTRQTYLIVDIGAGTTDVAGFICVNNPNWPRARVFEISGAAFAMRKAGNLLDQYLHKYIMERSSLTQDTTEFVTAAFDVRRQRRALKEQLFTQGKLVVALPTDETVGVDLQEFLKYPPVQDFSNSLRELVAQAAEVVAGDLQRIKLVATGGGSRLPFITELSDTGVVCGTRTVRFDLVEAMPAALAEVSPQLGEVFPQIAVAFGGALPDLPEERSNVSVGLKEAPKRVMAAMYKS